MGGGSYTSADWSRLKSSRKMTAGSNHAEIFKNKAMHQKFDPRFINKREARDSDEHPGSTPIIIGLDVTGSMGYLAETIAKDGLHETMMKLFSTKPVTDPQLMFSAVGDVTDDAPLQVTQFESDIRIAEQLMELWLEGAGGDTPEDYPLLWYFAAHHISADSFEKHGRKGYLFTIGDADCHDTISRQSIERIFGDKVFKDFTIKELAKQASQYFEIIHIHIKKSQSMPPELQNAIPGRIIRIDRSNVELIPELIVSTLLMLNGQTLEEVLKNWAPEMNGVLFESLSELTLPNKNKALSF